MIYLYGSLENAGYGDQMQLLGVTHLHLAHGAANRRQRALGDLYRVGIGVDQIESVEKFATGVLTLKDVDFQIQVLAVEKSI